MVQARLSPYRRDGSGTYSLVGINSSGSGYQVGDTVNISGASLGGLAGVNDLNLTITSLIPATYNVSQSSTTGIGSGAVYRISTDNSGNYTVTDITTFGENYALNDQVTIAGSNIGGTDTQNDATLTITSVGANTISNVTQASTSGNGGGAIFTIRSMVVVTTAWQPLILVVLVMNRTIALLCQVQAWAAQIQRMDLR